MNQQDIEVYGERCIYCNTYTTYDNLHVVDTIPDEDEEGQIKEIVVCKWCMEEEQH